MNILLYAPEYRPNLSNMIRSAEFFGFKKIFIYDENGLLDPPSNKVSRADMNHMARVWTAGAIEYIEIKKVESILPFLKNYDGRKVASVVDDKAQGLNSVLFLQDDLIIIGPEKEGLPSSVTQHCELKIYISGFGKTECLNASVAVGILINEALRQLKVNYII